MQPTFRARRLILAALLAPPLATRPATAQGVLVAPPGVFIDHRTRAGNIELYNPNDVPADVTLSTVFGYPVTDSTGKLSLRTIDSTDKSMPSAAGWLQAYPKRLVLAPKQRQTVRLLGRPPADLKDGEYWSRLVVAAKTAPNPADSLPDTTQIKVGITFEVRTVIGVWYRKGPVTTSVNFKGVEASAMGDSIGVRLHLERQGTAAFLGTAHATVLDAAGKQVASLDRQIAVYYALDPLIGIPSAALPAGTYTVRVEIGTDRSDFNSGVIQSTPVRAETKVTIPRR